MMDDGDQVRDLARRYTAAWRSQDSAQVAGHDAPNCLIQATRFASGTANKYDVGNRWAGDPHPQAGACNWSAVGRHTERNGGWVAMGPSNPQAP